MTNMCPKKSIFCFNVTIISKDFQYCKYNNDKNVNDLSSKPQNTIL